MQCPEKCRSFCVFVDDIRSHARGHGVDPIGSIAAESEIFLGESGFPPFLLLFLYNRFDKEKMKSISIRRI